MKFTHDLKILPVYYEAVLSGNKTFEIRKDDRNFTIYDNILLREWIPSEKRYTGREKLFQITYVLSSLEFPEGLKAGYCILGINRIFSEGEK